MKINKETVKAMISKEIGSFIIILTILTVLLIISFIKFQSYLIDQVIESDAAKLEAESSHRVAMHGNRLLMTRLNGCIEVVNYIENGLGLTNSNRTNGED